MTSKSQQKRLAAQGSVETIFPPLYAKDSKGGTKQWSIRIEGHPLDAEVRIIVEHGKLNGKLQTDTTVTTKGKNIGRSNETTVYQQAVADAESKFNKKRDRDRYSTELPDETDTTTAVAPMLALKYNERKHDVVFPAYVQPKLNGVRVLAFVDPGKRTVTFMSRKGKEYLGFDHIKQELLVLCQKPMVLDGEFFNPNLSLQEITSRVRREKAAHEDAEAIQYWIYDIAEIETPFMEREAKLFALLMRIQYASSSVIPVKTVVVHREKDILAHHKIFAQDYEGTMVRNAHGIYKFGHRSADLLKLKDFEEEEFEIVDVHGEAKGREEGLALFVCKAPGGTFTVRPKGSFDYRRKLLKDRTELLGKQLTVRFLEWSIDKIPQHPVGLVVRDYE